MFNSGYTDFSVVSRCFILFAVLFFVHCTDESFDTYFNRAQPVVGDSGCGIDSAGLNKADSMVRAPALDNNPWVVCNKDQLSLIRKATGEYSLADNYFLARDIDMEGGGFSLIGTSETPFVGIFNANGKTITNFRIQSSALSITDRPIFGFYVPASDRFVDYPPMDTEEICDIVGVREPGSHEPIIYNSEEGGGRLICQADQLSNERAYIRTTGLSENYFLGKDISLSAAFIPLGGVFTGTFYGNYKTISGLAVSGDSSDVGFFGQINAGGVRDLNFMNPNVSSTATEAAHIGVLAGRLLGAEALVENVNVLGDLAVVSGNSSNTNTQNIGGLVGLQSGGTLTNSMGSGDVSTGGAGADNLGGLVGLQSGGALTNSMAIGDVSTGGGGLDNLGGLVGSQTASSSASSIESSISLGNVSAGDNLGGLIGAASGSGSTQVNLYWNTETSGLTVAASSGLCTSGCTAQTTTQLIEAGAETLTGLSTPSDMPPGPWSFGESKYPGLVFNNADDTQTCTLRPVLVSGSATGTDSEFGVCPEEINENSFHSACRTKPTGCPD